LDDLTPDEVAAELGVPVVPAGPLPSQALAQLGAWFSAVVRRLARAGALRWQGSGV